MIPNKRLIQIFWQCVKDMFNFEIIYFIFLFSLVMLVTSL
jgi:hypothetical protein